MAALYGPRSLSEMRRRPFRPSLRSAPVWGLVAGLALAVTACGGGVEGTDAATDDAATTTVASTDGPTATTGAPAQAGIDFSTCDVGFGECGTVTVPLDHEDPDGPTIDVAVTRIPAAALAMEDAMMLHRMQDRGDKVVVKLEMEAKMLPDADSRNVMAEIVGSEHPEEVVVMGGHIDSWDVGQGAMDDGGGVVAAWEALKVIQRLGLKPRRTIRVVGWTNEENGTRGGVAYRDARGADVAKHILAIESDGGVFKPTGFDYGGPPQALAVLKEIGRLLAPLGADTVEEGGGEADIGPLMEKGVPGLGLRVQDDKYFWYHHTQGDTLDKLDPAELAQCVAAMAVMAYVAADLPEGLK